MTQDRTPIQPSAAANDSGKNSAPGLAAWTTADTANLVGETIDNLPAGSQSLDELVDLVECLELLDRVWPENDGAGSTLAGAAIGPYTLVREIGRGGMGSVWEAQQEEPVPRRVAVKLINPDGRGDQALARFEAERSLLARMEHPNIARINDAGTTQQGRLWFAMELVQGTDILKYCLENQLPLRHRLELMTDVCHAVQHAHQKGVIHRDLKPSNVLVQDVEGKPIVKVIDFGLARLLDRDEFEVSAETRTGAILGSIWHMSPEQTVSGADVDTRTDVFLLGSLLYQLLTGSYLLNQKEIGSDDLAKILIAIREQQPIRPSRQVSLDADGAGFGDATRAVVASLQRELDWLVMRAVEKEPGRRYQSAAEFASDINRFLNDEPIVARPPSRLYAGTKYVRRHKALVASIASLAAAVVITAIVATVGYFRVSEANESSQRSLARATASNSILSDIFNDLDPDSIEAGTAPLRIQLGRRLVEASKRLEPESVAAPLEVARLQLQLARTLNRLGFYEEAMPVCELAYDRLRSHPEAQKDAREAGRQLAWANLRSAKFSEAGDLLRQLLQESEANGDQAEILETIGMLSTFHYSEGNIEEAIELGTRAAERRAALLGSTHPDTLESRLALAHVLVFAMKEDQAVPILEDCLAELRRTRPNHPRTISAMSSLAWALARTPGGYSKSPAIAKEAYELAIRIFGPTHEVTYDAMVQVAISNGGAGNLGQARERLKTAIEGLQQTRSAESRTLIQARTVLARIADDTGDAEVALGAIEENILVMQRLHAPQHPVLLNAMAQLGKCRRLVGDYAGAASALLHVLDESKDSPGSLLVKRELGNTFFDEGRYGEACRIFEELRSEAEATNARQGFEAIVATAELAKSLSADGQAKKAVEVLQSALAKLPEGPGPAVRMRGILSAQLGIVLARDGQAERGIELMLPMTRVRIAPQYREYLLEELRRAYWQAGDENQLLASFRDEVAANENRLGSDSRLLGLSLVSLSHDLCELGQCEYAIELLDRATGLLDTTSWEHKLATVRRHAAALAVLDDESASGTIEAAMQEAEVAYARAAQALDERYPIRRKRLRSIAGQIVGTLQAREVESSVWQSRATD